MAPQQPDLPSVAQYRQAFEAIRNCLTGNQLKMLQYHLERRRPVTASELATVVGYKNWRAVNAQYGRVGVLLRAELPQIASLPGQQSHAFAWFDRIPRADGGYAEWIWTFHDPVKVALESLPWLQA